MPAGGFAFAAKNCYFSLAMKNAFTRALAENQNLFDLNLKAETIEKLGVYYEIVQARNPLLHLVAPCSPETFATRHVLESLALLEYLPVGARFADVGAGAGLPGIPCLLAREDFSAVLIESKAKKAEFLKQVLAELDLKTRAETINRQFEEVPALSVPFVASRALDKFTQKLPRLLKWSNKASKLFFGGNALRAELEKHNLSFREKLLPLSEKRFLFIIE